MVKSKSCLIFAFLTFLSFYMVATGQVVGVPKSKSVKNVSGKGKTKSTDRGVTNSSDKDGSTDKDSTPQVGCINGPCCCLSASDAKDEKKGLEKYPATTGAVATILAALTAAFIASRGIIFQVRRNAEITTEVRDLEMKQKYVEAQLEKFYGPLLAECIEADGMFRRVELAIESGTKGEQKHYDFRTLTHEHFNIKYGEQGVYPCATEDISERERFHRFFARMLQEVLLPSNEKRMNIVQNNLHLLGPSPPTSIALFMSHAAQLRALIKVKEYLPLNVPSTPNNEDRYADPYVLTPFPAMMTGEIAAKVALLKGLQNEFRHRLSAIVKSRKESVRLFCRQNYYLLLEEDIWEKLNKATDADYKDRPPNHRAFYPLTFPLVWGPYKAIELFELRSWLIVREQFIREMKGLDAEKKIYLAMLCAKVAKLLPNETCIEDKGTPQIEQPTKLQCLPPETSEDGAEAKPTVTPGKRRKRQRSQPTITGEVVCLPLSHRIHQLFDELDYPSSKKNHYWDASFTWESMQTGKFDTYLAAFELTDHQLHNLPNADNFAYEKKEYRNISVADFQ